MSEHVRTTLMTGVTGFLGHFVLRELLQRTGRVVVVLRSPVEESLRRLEGMMQRLDTSLVTYLESGRLVAAEGNLPDRLPPARWGRTEEVLACAASLQLFSNGNGEPYRTNVAGTEALIDWACRHDVPRIHSVSTAYVCGSLGGAMAEAFHARPPSFQTEYERSKWEAEERYARWARRPGAVLTLFRPGFLVGDSRSGYTTQFGGFYQFARLVSLLKEQYAAGANGDGTYIPHRIPGRPDAPIQNLVPVDFAARIIGEVVGEPSLHGRIYHLTDPEPPTWDDFKQWLEEYFHLHGGSYVDCERLTDENPAERLLWEKYELFLPRIHHHIRFEQANTRRVMAERGIEFPRLNKGRFFSLLDYAVSQRWGQKSRSGRARRGRHVGAR
jgi:nucleoside-diphosphate-sugar epimerase